LDRKVQSLAVVCAKFHTILCNKIAAINSSLNLLIFNYKVFFLNLYVQKMFGL